MNSPRCPQQRILEIARLAAKHSPRWRQLLGPCLQGRGPRGIEDLPIVDKRALFGTGDGSARSLMIDKELSELVRVYLSSGTSGGARSWTALDRRSAQRERERLTRAFIELWGLKPCRSILLLNMMPTGVTVTLEGVLSIETGPTPSAVVDTLQIWAAEFETVFLIAEPWTLKAALELASERGVDLEGLNVHAAVGGELLPEGLRAYLRELIGVGGDTSGGEARILSSMGCSEYGLHAFWETRATASLRRMLGGDRRKIEAVCGSPLAVAPCLMSYDTDELFLEFVDSELVMTCLDSSRPVPLIRYRLGDRGGFVDRRAAQALLIEGGRPELSEQLPEALIWIAGRASGYTITEVGEPRQLEEVEALRRAVFERELGRDYGGLEDSLDAYSLVLLGEHQGRAVCTARLTLRADGPLEDESELLLERWRDAGGFDDREIALCSRLLVVPEHRGRGAVKALISALYRASARLGVRLCFIDAPIELVAYYHRLGFRVFREAYRHPRLGAEYVPLVLFIGDADYFESLGSPLTEFAGPDSAGRARGAYAGFARSPGAVRARTRVFGQVAT